MKKFIVLTGLLVAAAAFAFGQGSATRGKSVLIYTRNGEGYVHKNIAASVEALEEICSGLGVQTQHTDDPAIFEIEELQEFDAIIFSNSNNEAFVNPQQRENFKKFILSGKGFMGVHSANASERDWPWYRQMMGGKFIRHPKLQKFDIRVIDHSHPSTSHLPEIWHWEDECYFSTHLNPAIDILLTVDLTTLTDDKKDEYPGNVFGDQFPLAWCQVFEGTRVFYTALGHKIAYYDNPDFRKHLEGGILWTLGQSSK